jgi:ribose transport system permease protein
MTYKNARRLISIGLVIALGLIFALTTESFLTARNMFLLMREAAYTGIIAYGMACIIVGGGIDLSAGGIVCFVGIMTARASLIPGIPGVCVLLIAILAGAACGCVNAFVVVKLHLSAFVTTLASGFAFAGLALMSTFRVHGRAVSQSLSNESFLHFGSNIGGLYFITVIWIAFGIFLQLFLTRTQFWVHLCALGSNEKSAVMSGVNGNKVKSVSFIMGGGFYGLASAMVVAFQTGTTSGLGNMMEFSAIAACVVGGVEMTGGKGDALSAFMGTLFMTLITNGLYKLGLSTGGLLLMQGVVIVLMINFDVQFGKFSEKRLRLASDS